MIILFTLLLYCICGCQQSPSTSHHPSTIKYNKSSDSLPPLIKHSIKSQTALYLDSLGFINIAEADSTIAIDLIYTRSDNFTGSILYRNLHEAYLHPDALKSLLQAQKILQDIHPQYRLIVYDAARPLSVQQTMWNTVKGTSKYHYVSNPANGGGLHNYGLAVDISILDETGKPLSMGTPVDYLGEESHITHEPKLVKLGKISIQEMKNRQLLRKIMQKAGFHPLPTEWWHFNRVRRNDARKNYTVIP